MRSQINCIKFGSVVQLVRMLPCHLAWGETGSSGSFEMYFFYIIESLVDGDYYKGSCSDYSKRLTEHNNGESQFTRSKMPWKLIFVQMFDTKKEGLIEEKRLKRCNKEYLRWLIRQPINIVNNTLDR